MDRKYIYAMLLLAATLHVTAAEEKLPENSTDFLKESLNCKQGDSFEDCIISGGLLDEMNSYDFSSVWLEHNDALLGFIGTDNYQRIRIRFLSVTKDPTNPINYFVSGKTMVHSTICSFQGEIQLLYIKQENVGKEEKQTLFAEFHDKGEVAKRYLSPEYILLARYSFYEDSKARKTGKFSGVLKSYFYLYENVAYYNDLRIETNDDYRNNQYVGMWTSYASGKSKICNWGEFRIPGATGLDIGAGEFSPNPKYYPHGWASYANMLFAEDNGFREEALKEERKEWWK